MAAINRARRAGRDDRRAAQSRAGARGWPRAALIGLGGAAIGYVAAFLADPARGRARRARLVDQATATVRRAARASARALRAVATTADGKMQAITAAGTRVGPIDDVTLRDRAETTLFRDPDVPKGSININVERGVLVLRGEVPDAAMRERLRREAERIDGVWSVRNLLHLPGEPAEEMVGSRG